MKITAISTTTHIFKKSTTAVVLSEMKKYAENKNHEYTIINANKLHIVKNLSCYANGAKKCASKDAGRYRCWAHKASHEDPEKFGGKDQMPVLYDAFDQSDIVLFSTAVRWMSHTAIMQSIIERMNTLENRVSVYGEKSPLEGKKCGIITVGQHYKAQEVAEHLAEVMRFMGFTVPPNALFTWQKTLDINEEQGDTSNAQFIKRFLAAEEGKNQLKSFCDALGI